jgi:hypothetical protein
MIYRLIQEIPSADIPRVIDAAQHLPPKTRKAISAALLEHWLKSDAPAAGTWAQNHFHNPAIASAWAHAAPLAALTAVLGSNGETSYWDAPKIALAELAGEDPHARISLLASLPAGANRDQLLSQEIVSLAKTDPSEALNAAKTRLTGKFSDAAVRSVLLEWAQIDPVTAATKLDLIATDLKAGLCGNAFISNFTRNMAQKDPSAALEFAASLPEELRKYPLIAAATAWAKSDPIEALSWSIDNGIDVTRHFRTERMSTSDSVLRAALGFQPNDTVDWLLSLPAGAEGQRLIREGFERTINWRVVNSPEGEIDALSLASRLFNALPPVDQAKFANEYGAAIARKDTYPEPEEWKSRFGDETVRAHAVAGAIGAVFSQSATRGEALLAKLPEGMTRDLALAQAAFAQGFSAPASACDHAVQIKDQESRYSALDRLVPQWIKKDESGCRAWLENNTGLSPKWVSDWMMEAKLP